MSPGLLWPDFTEEGGYFGKWDFLIIAQTEFSYVNSENFLEGLCSIFLTPQSASQSRLTAAIIL
ncbi:hypothetical protein ASE99_23370 [Serratia sp. Leaf51]|nr:hypothetical protein ASE99_23370 [Serratia sp. Leaf51]